MTIVHDGALALRLSHLSGARVKVVANPLPFMSRETTRVALRPRLAPTWWDRRYHTKHGQIKPDHPEKKLSARPLVRASRAIGEGRNAFSVCSPAPPCEALRGRPAATRNLGIGQPAFRHRRTSSRLQSRPCGTATRYTPATAIALARAVRERRLHRRLSVDVPPERVMTCRGGHGHLCMAILMFADPGPESSIPIGLPISLG
jgi:hypothetical protein